MKENQREGLKDIAQESRSEVIGQYRQAFEAFQQISNVICRGEFSKDNAQETTFEFYRAFGEYSSPRYSSIRKEVVFGDRDNKFAPGDHQKSTEVIGEIETSGSYRKASMDLLEQGRMVIDAGGGDEECDIVGWNFIRLGFYLQAKTLFGSRTQPEEDVKSTTDVTSPSPISFLEIAANNELRDSIKAELMKFVKRRTLRRKIKEEDVPLLLNLKVVRKEASKKGLEGSGNRLFLLDEFLDNFIRNLRGRDVQSNNEELAESEILLYSFVHNMPNKKIAERLDIAYPTSYFKRRVNAINRLIDELIILEISEKGEDPHRTSE